MTYNGEIGPTRGARRRGGTRVHAPRLFSLATISILTLRSDGLLDITMSTLYHQLASYERRLLAVRWARAISPTHLSKRLVSAPISDAQGGAARALRSVMHIRDEYNTAHNAAVGVQ